MKKFVVAAVASVVLQAFPLLAAGPATAPSPLLDAVRGADWDAIPRRLKLQSASAGALVEPDQAKVAAWINEYRDQQAKFGQDRRKLFDNAVRDTQILNKGGYADLAMDGVADCYTLAVDKEAFAKSDWVQALGRDALVAADKAAGANEWLKARRIYTDLSVLQPTESKWTHGMEDMTRRIRILTRYAPETFADVLKREFDYHKAARKYLVAATRPATRRPPRSPRPRARARTSSRRTSRATGRTTCATSTCRCSARPCRTRRRTTTKTSNTTSCWPAPQGHADVRQHRRRGAGVPGLVGREQEAGVPRRRRRATGRRRRAWGRRRHAGERA